MGTYHPHGDTSIYDALVRLAQPWSLRYPLIDGNGNFGSPGQRPARRPALHRVPAASRWPWRCSATSTRRPSTSRPTTTAGSRARWSCRAGSRTCWSTARAASRSAWRPTSRRTTCARSTRASSGSSSTPRPSREELLEALMERIKGPDFPTGALIVGREGIDDAYRTGRGSDPHARGRRGRGGQAAARSWSSPSCRTRSTPTTLAEKIAELVKEGRIDGIADIKDESQRRTGQRLVIVLKRDAVAKVVLNNLYKHTQLQDTFGVNMLAIVDGVPRTLRLDELVRYSSPTRSTSSSGAPASGCARPRSGRTSSRACSMALDHLDEVIALIRNSASADAARGELMERFELVRDPGAGHPRHAAAPARRARAAAHHRRATPSCGPRSPTSTTSSPAPSGSGRSSATSSPRSPTSTATSGAPRIVPVRGRHVAEDLIAQEDVVVTVTRGGYAKRTKTDLYRAQRRGGKGVQGAPLREDDIVEHFFVTTTHHWLLFFTNKGRVYRAKAHELPEQARARRRAARRQHPRVPAGRADRPGDRDPRLRRGALPRARDPRRPGEEDRARATSTPTAAAASSRSTCATTTS